MTTRCGTPRNHRFPRSGEQRVPRQVRVAFDRGEMERYFRLIRKESGVPELYQQLAAVASLDMVRQLNDPRKSAREIAAMRPAFLKEPARCRLNDYLRQRLAYYLDRLAKDPSDVKFSSMLVLDVRGRMLAAAYDNQLIDFSVAGTMPTAPIFTVVLRPAEPHPGRYA